MKTVFTILGVVAVFLLMLFLIDPRPDLAGRAHRDLDRCRVNLRIISDALHKCAHEHNGQFPGKLSDLVREGYDVETENFICPAGWGVPAYGDSPAKAADAMDRQDGDSPHVDYLYFGDGLLDSSPPGDLLVSDPPGNHEGGGNVLYVDGRIVFLGATDLQKTIAENASRMKGSPKSLP